MKQDDTQPGMTIVAALLLFSIAALLISGLSLQRLASHSATVAFGGQQQARMEADSLGRLVREAILALAETAPTNEPGSLETAIETRLNAWLINASGVTLSPIGTYPDLPAHNFYPAAASPGVTRDMTAVMANDIGLASLIDGPYTPLGTVAMEFVRSNGNALEDRTYRIIASLFSVPLTNYDLIAYGLPATISPPPAPPVEAAGVVANLPVDGHALILTENDPAADSTASPDFFSGAAILPSAYRSRVSLAWNAWEWVWSDAYLQTLLSAASVTWNLDQTKDENAAVNGFDFDDDTGVLTVDLSAVSGRSLVVVAPSGGGEIILHGGNGGPGVVAVLNPGPPSAKTTVRLEGGDPSPRLRLLTNSALSTDQGAEINGALWLGPACSASGSLRVDGSFAFHALSAAQVFPALDLTLNPASASTGDTLAAVSPRALLVGVRGEVQ
ncbi:MAG: hypothetical protein ACQKBV_12425 [Puniceicoccales bacterium]